MHRAYKDYDIVYSLSTMRGGPRFYIGGESDLCGEEAYFRFTPKGQPYLEIRYKDSEQPEEWHLVFLTNAAAKPYVDILKDLNKEFYLQPSNEGVRDLREETKY